MKTYECCVLFLVKWRAMNMAINLAHRMFWLAENW